MKSFQLQHFEKQFGNIPTSWEKVRLGDLFEERQETSNDVVKYPLHSLTIESGIVPKTERYNRTFLLRDEEGNQYRLVHPGDVVFNPMNLRFGAIAYSECDSIVAVSAYYNVLKPRKGTCDPKYLYTLLSSPQMINLYDSIAIGSLVEKRRVHLSEFIKIVVPLPPLNEQGHIGLMLHEWNTAIALADKLLAAKKKRKQALMQQLLSGSRRFKEFERQARQQIRIEDIATINPKKSLHLSDGMTVSFIAMADISEDAQIMNTTKRTYQEVKKGFTSFENGDVLVAKITPCFENGKGAWANNLENGFGFGSTEFHVIRADILKANPQFLYYHTLDHKFRSKGESSMSGSAGQKRVPAEFIKDYKIMLPQLDEQRKIVSVLETCDAELDLLTRKLAALKQQKKGLMQKLLTGQIRVKV